MEMNNNSFLSILLLLSFCWSSAAMPVLERRVCQPESWDYLKLAQQWPPTFCLNSKSSDVKCSDYEQKYPPTWTIHGLWPDYKNENKGPECCKFSGPFNVSSIESLEKSLVNFWPNLRSGDFDEFWSYEWKEHGRCATTLPVLNTEYKYFSNALHLHNTFDLYRELANNGVTPDDSKPYKLSDLTKVLGSDVIIQCVNYQGKEYLSQIHICIDKSLHRLPCPLVTNSCSSNKAIYYLHF